MSSLGKRPAAITLSDDIVDVWEGDEEKESTDEEMDPSYDDATPARVQKEFDTTFGATRPKRKKRKVAATSSSSSSSSQLLLPPPPPPPLPNNEELLLKKLRTDMECIVCRQLIVMAKQCLRGHVICAECYSDMGGSRLKCPTCNLVDDWADNLAVPNFAEMCFPEEFKARHKVAWIGAAGPNLVAEIRRRIDPKFDILADKGEYRRALRYIAQVAVEGGPNKAKRIHELVVRRDQRTNRPLRHFLLQVIPVSEAYWGQNDPHGKDLRYRSVFCPHNEAFVVSLMSNIYSIMEFPEVLDDYEISNALSS